MKRTFARKKRESPRHKTHRAEAPRHAREYLWTGGLTKPGRERRSILDLLAGVSGQVEASEGLADIPRGSAGVRAGVVGALGLGMALDKDTAQVAGMALDKDTVKALGRASSVSLCGHAPVWAWEMVVRAPDAVRALRRFDSWPVAI
jgi:hypothetical protein